MLAAVRDYLALFLQNEFRRAIDGLLASTAKTKPLQRLRRRGQARFIDGKDLGTLPRESALATDVVTAFRRYYCRGFLANGASVESEQRLISDLASITGTVRDETIWEKTRLLLEQAGYHLSLGVTVPFRCLYMWRDEETLDVEVPLVDGVQPVRVVMMKDFVAHGWMHFGTFGKLSTGGWATAEQLNCVAAMYKPDSTRFRVNYLTHEAQHLADNRAFPLLQQLDLEYRAKLAELHAAPRPTSLAKKFAREATMNKGNPHGYAAHLVMTRLSALLGCEGILWKGRAVRSAAAELIASHTKELQRVGAEQVESLFGD